ncbi:MAG: DUF481 domain-containing protein, partial [Pirellulaceae bacterium]
MIAAALIAPTSVQAQWPQPVGTPEMLPEVSGMLDLSAQPTEEMPLDAAFPSDVDVPVGSSVGTALPLVPEKDAASEPLPLEGQTMRWYAYPYRWFTKGWTNHVEFGLNGSTGNSETLSLQTGAELKRKTDVYTLLFDLDYVRTKTANVLTQNLGRFDANFDRMLGESRWSAFSKLGLEWNEFKPFDLRVNMNSGAGYYWLRDDTSTFVTRFGAGASREFGSPDDEWVPEALFGVESEHQITAAQKLKARIDYFPSWSDFSDYRLVSDISWEMLLDGTDNLSLKLAATNRYDSTPQGALPNDLLYSLLLL